MISSLFELPGMLARGITPMWSVPRGLREDIVIVIDHITTHRKNLWNCAMDSTEGRITTVLSILNSSLGVGVAGSITEALDITILRTTTTLPREDVWRRPTAPITKFKCGGVSQWTVTSLILLEIIEKLALET